MAYSDCEAALATLLAAATGFSADQVTRGDFRVLDKGVDKSPCVVLMPGDFNQDKPFMGASTREMDWECVIWLFASYEGEAVASIALQDAREAILNKIAQNTTLTDQTGRVIRVRVPSADAPADVFDDNNNGPFFLAQAIRARINELVTPA